MADGDQATPQIDPNKISALIQAMQGNSSGLTGDGSATVAPQGVDPRIALIQAARGDSSGFQPAQTTPQSTPSPQGGALPPSSPFDIGAIFRQLASQPEISQPRSQMEDVRRQLAEKQQAYETMPRPKTGWLDTQGQPPAPGFGHSILRALTALAASTRPGQAIQRAVYEPGMERYGIERQSLADQIATLKDQAGISEKELGTGQALAGTAGMTGYRQGELGIQQMNANTRQIAEQHRNINTQNMQALTAKYQTGKLTQEQARTEIMKLNNELGQRRLQALTQLQQQGQQLHWDEATMTNQRSLLEAEFNRQAQEIVAHPIMSMFGMTPQMPSQVTPLSPKAAPQSPGGTAQKPKTSKPGKNPHSDLGVIYPGQP